MIHLATVRGADTIQPSASRTTRSFSILAPTDESVGYFRFVRFADSLGCNPRQG